MNCADCNTKERRIGSRCWRCYLHWTGRKHGLAKYTWWKERYNIMEAALYGRYFMLSCGQEQGDIWKTFLFIWPERKGLKRPAWIHTNRAPRQKAAMFRIVANLDRRARREYGQSKAQK